MRTGYPEDAQMEREMKDDPRQDARNARHRHPAQNIGMGEALGGLANAAKGPTSMDNVVSDLKNAVDKANHAVQVSDDILNKIRGPQPKMNAENDKVPQQPNNLLEDLNQIGSHLDEALNQLSQNLNEITELI